MAALLLIALPSCSLFGSDPVVEEVFIIGTRVPSDFLTTGSFELVATPVDEDGTAILTSDPAVEVEVVRPLDLTANPSFLDSDPVSGAPLAIGLVLDGSGSMSGNDPQRLRVSGAREFVSRLSGTPGLDWEASVYTYSSGVSRRADYTSSVADLNTAIASVGASGGTATYPTLLRVLSDGAAERPSPDFDPGIVLLSDGSPDSSVDRPAVCSEAVRLGVPIYSIGLGPASDISAFPSASAVAEMREVARCSEGVYSGIAADDPAAVERIYRSVATATSLGSVSYRVTVDGPGFASLRPGDRIQLSLSVESGGATVSSPFEIAVPNPNARVAARRSGAE